VGGACGTHGRGQKRVKGFGGKTGRKMTTCKTKTEVEGWAQNGTLGDWLGGGWSGFTWLRIGIVGGLL
jgi:hypothetical protein